MSSGRRCPILLVALLAACGGGAPGGAGPGGADAAGEISAMLHASAESWNAGDLDGFLDDYLDSPETAFVGGSGVTRGVAEIRARYIRSYWSSGRPEHALRFEDLEITPLGDQHALALGRYVLAERDGGAVAATGFFSLVLRRTPQGWRIIHDHSSASS